MVMTENTVTHGKRLAAVLLGTAVDKIALVDIMERHKT